jgi:hypothetical protein
VIPVSVVKEIAENWLADFNTRQEGLEILAVASGMPADTWRVRLSGLTYESPHTGIVYPRGWWAQKRLPVARVDEFLDAAGLAELWYLPPLERWRPKKKVKMSDEEFDSTCAECGATIDWTSPVAGVRLELRRPRKWTQWWSLCAPCAAEKMPIPRMAGVTGNKRRIPDAEIRLLYKQYLVGGGAERVAAGVWEKYGYASEKSCAIALTNAWQTIGLPLRSRVEARRANQATLPPKLGRLTESQVRAAYLLHTKQDLSLNEIGRRMAPQLGVKPRVAASYISDGFKALGLKARDRIEMTVAVSTKNGLSPRDQKLRRRLRQEAGFTTTLQKRQPPCKHIPCQRVSMRGSDFCCSHDPNRKETTEQSLARMRATAHKDLVDGTATILFLREAYSHASSWRELGERCQMNPDVLRNISRYELGTRMKPKTIAKIMAGLAPDFRSDDLELAA